MYVCRMQVLACILNNMEYTEKALNILDTSRRLFASKGFKTVTTKEIAKESKVNEVTIFRHFKNKDSLFEKMLIYYMSKPKASDFIEENEKDIEKYLFGIGRLIQTIFLENLDLFKIELIERQKLESMNLINSFPNEIKNKMQNFLIGTYHMKKNEASVFSVSFMTAVHGLCMNLYFLKTFTPIPDFNECLKFIIKKFK